MASALTRRSIIGDRPRKNRSHDCASARNDGGESRVYGLGEAMMYRQHEDSAEGGGAKRTEGEEISQKPALSATRSRGRSDAIALPGVELRREKRRRRRRYR
jgi:hypothetical protein